MQGLIEVARQVTDALRPPVGEERGHLGASQIVSRGLIERGQVDLRQFRRVHGCPYGRWFAQQQVTSNRDEIRGLLAGQLRSKLPGVVLVAETSARADDLQPFRRYSETHAQAPDQQRDFRPRGAAVE